MALSVETVSNASQLKEFINLPFAINKNFPCWVPPLKRQDMEMLAPGRHPFWQTARRELFMVRDNGIPLGRIAAIVDEKYNSYAREKCGAFGFFECVDNTEAAHSLLEAAREWLEAAGMEFMRGPLNPSTNYTCGMLVAGFELPPAIMMPWNPPYYPELLESWRLRKEQDLFAYIVERDKVKPPQRLREELERIKAQDRFTFRCSSKASMRGDIHTMLEIYRQSWADNWGFSPLSGPEADALVKELKGVVDPELFVLFFHRGDPAGGMVALPDLNPLLKRLNGSIGLTAPWHFMRARKSIRESYRIMLFGILPRYRLYGLPLLLFAHMLNIAGSRPGFRSVEGSWVLEDNAPIDDLIEDFGGQLAKRYRIYRREIGQCLNVHG